MMKKTHHWKWISVLLLLLLLLPLFNGEAARKVELIGQETPNFTLPSTFDRVINYGRNIMGGII